MNLFGRPLDAVLLLVKVGISAVAGGLLGISVLVWLDDDKRALVPYLFVVVLGVTALSVMAAAALQSADAGSEDSNLAVGSMPPWGTPSPTPPLPIGRPTTPGAADIGPQWYDDAARHAAALRTLPAPGAAPPTAGPAPLTELESVDDAPARVDELRAPGRRGNVRRIVQCPRCAAFDLDVWEEGAGFAFGCRACRQRWRCATGAARPPTVVRPALSRTRPPTGPC
jgi:hypothetical protein